ncbi:MAG: hypothetical protein ACRDRK_16785 [Pseudonocardia sp.]
MNTRLEIQGRLVVHRNGKIVRDDVRHAQTTDLDEAHRIAREIAAEGFAVWIYAVEPGSGTTPRYRRVDGPDPASPGRGRSGGPGARQGIDGSVGQSL